MRASRSISSTGFRLRVERRIPSSAMEAPVVLVCIPAGVTGVRVAAAERSISLTSSMDSGRATLSGRYRKPDASAENIARISGSVSSRALTLS